MKNKKITALLAAFPFTVPVMLGYLFVGMAFGMLLEDKGYNFLWAMLMSLTVYAGSMQFVAVNFFDGGLTLAGIALTTLVINFRHMFYGLSFIDTFKKMGRLRPYMIFSLTDETYSLLCATKVPEGVDGRWFLFFISLLNQLYWIAGSALGACAGRLLRFDTRGLDFAMTALFVVIFVEQWLTYPTHIPALSGLACGLLCLVVFGPQNLIIPAIILIVLVLMAFRGPITRRFDAKEAL